MSGRDAVPEGGFAPLVPELDVFDIDKSLRFWCDALGFRIAYRRPESGFAYLERDRAQIMLCRRNGAWETAPLEPPLGRGVNFQIMVESLEPILAALAEIGWPLFRAPETAWYRVGDSEAGQRECLVQDPDGYLLRFAEDLGLRVLR